MEDVNAYRLYALQCHLNLENFVNMFITRYIQKSIYNGPREYYSDFEDLILNDIAFSKKIKIISQIFKDKNKNDVLLEIFSSKFVFNNKNEVTEVNIHGRIFKVNDLIKHLERVNAIRNHLAHSFYIFDPNEREDLAPFKNSKVDINLKGDRSQLDESHKYAVEFLHGLSLELSK